MLFLARISKLFMKHKAQFVIRPNGAVNNHLWPWFFLLLAVTCLNIGLRFAFMGYWMILPFAVVDVVAVGLILYMLALKSAYVEKIIVDRNFVVIRHIQKKNRQSWKLPLYWTQVKLEKPVHHWYAPRLLMGCKGQWIEIGQCLTESERKSLACAIQEQITQLLVLVKNGH